MSVIVPQSDINSLHRPIAHDLHPHSFLSVGEKKYSVSIQVVTHHPIHNFFLSIRTLFVPKWTKYATFSDGKTQIIVSVADARTGKYTPLTKEMKHAWSDVIHRMATVERLQFVDMRRPFSSAQCAKLMRMVAMHTTDYSSRIGGKQGGERIFPTGVLVAPNGIYIKQASTCAQSSRAEHTPKGEILGTGSFKKVFNAHFIPFDPTQPIHDVAWEANRRFDDPLTRDAENLLLIEEGRLASSINEGGKVVPLVHTLVEDDMKPILIQEKFSMNLLSYIQTNGNVLTPKKKAFILLELAKKIKLLHDKGYAHNDIKPENILIQTSPEGSIEIAISDLGFTNKNDFQTPCGTSQYFSPIFCAKLEHGRRKFFKAECQTNDCWAFGLIALMIFTPDGACIHLDEIRPTGINFNEWKPEDQTSVKMKEVLQKSFLNPVKHINYNMDDIIRFLAPLTQ